MIELIQAYHAQREVCDGIKEKLSQQNSILKSIESELIEEAAKAGVSKLPVLDGLPSYQIHEKTSVKTIDKSKVAAWALGTDRKELLSVNANTLKGIVTEMQENGDILPEGIAIKTYKAITRRKA